MTQAQRDACLGGIIPEETDPAFFAQHFSAYTFVQPFAAGKRMLEIGFGDGYGCRYLAETAAEVVGVDMAAENIPRAQAKYPLPNLTFVHMDGTTLQFPEASFDVVGSFQVIEHVPEPDLPDFLAGIRRVLRPGGLCCFSTLNLAHNMKPGRPYEKLCYHEKEFTGPELRALLERAFPRVELYGLYPTTTHRVYRRLKRWGLNRWGPPAWNPVARFYQQMTTRGFVVRPTVTDRAIDLYAVCHTAAG